MSSSRCCARWSSPLPPTGTAAGEAAGRGRVPRHSASLLYPASLARRPPTLCKAGCRTFMRHMLEELAFVSGGRRMEGDVLIGFPDVVLCCCDAGFARLWCGDLEEFGDVPPFVEFAGAHVMTRAMGGLSPEIETEPIDYNAPLDQAYDPTAAAELAAALEVFSMNSLVVPPRVRYIVEKFSRWDVEVLGTVEEFVRGAAGEIREIYVQARGRRLGVDVNWHSNP